MKDVLLVKYGEIALRGKNRFIFVNRLMETLKKRIGSDEYKIYPEQGRLLIQRDEGDVDYEFLMPRVITVLGVVGFCPCIKIEDQSIESLEAAALEFMKRHYKNPFTFKVEARRSDKKYPLDSREICARIGGYIFEDMENSTVDVKKPEVTLFVELRTRAYIYSNVINGFSGLPAGSSGKGMLLLSGGIDSPVAGFTMARRGVELEAVYFDSPPFTSERAREKVFDLCARLADFTGGIKLHVVHFTEIQTYLYEHTPPEKLMILLKRAMIRTGEFIALERGCLCLITGDSVGQVASQTLRSLDAINSAAERLTILRPLAGSDKREIMDLAQKIGTYDISIRPYEDCCTVFVPKHPEVRPKRTIIESIESNQSGLMELITAAATSAEVFNFD